MYNLPKDRKEVFDRISGDIQSQFPTVSFFKVNFFTAIAKFCTGRFWDIYKKIELVIRESFLQSAIFEDSIKKTASLYGLSQNASTQAQGFITLSGTAGSNVPIDTIFVNENGDEYKTLSDATISTSNTGVSFSRVGTIVTVTYGTAHKLATGFIIDEISGDVNFNTTNQEITVLSELTFQFEMSGVATSGTGICTTTSGFVEVKSLIGGDNKNLLSGSPLTLSSPISGVDNQSYVQYSAITGGNDIESIQDLKTRTLFRIQNPHAFFNNNEIISQAKKVNGITRVWVFNPDTTTGSKSISAITRNGQIATATCVGHGRQSGFYVKILGADQPEYNIQDERILKIDNDTFAFVVQGSPASATGTITMSYSVVEEGQVKVFATNDKQTNIIPSSQVMNLVKDKILEIKPAHTIEDDIIVQSPVSVPIDIIFSSLTPNTTLMRTAINASLYDFFHNFNNIGISVKLRDINSTIANTIDESGNRPSFTLSAPSSDTTISDGEIGTLGTIT